MFNLLKIITASFVSATFAGPREYSEDQIILNRADKS